MENINLDKLILKKMLRNIEVDKVDNDDEVKINIK